MRGRIAARLEALERELPALPPPDPNVTPAQRRERLLALIELIRAGAIPPPEGARAERLRAIIAALEERKREGRLG